MSRQRPPKRSYKNVNRETSPDVVDPWSLMEAMEREEKTDQGSRVSRPAASEGRRSSRSRSSRGRRKPSQQGRRGYVPVVFITGTDTDVGKTIVSCILGALLRRKGLRVGYLKPVQCGGDDARTVREFWECEEHLCRAVYSLRDPVSPHVAFPRQKWRFQREHVFKAFEELKSQTDIVLIEGAGGLAVPITSDFSMADLARQLDCPLLIVSRPGLGTLNHTALTIAYARQQGLSVSGVVLNAARSQAKGLAEKTNPAALRRLNDVSLLGSLPFWGEKFLEKQRNEIVEESSRRLTLKPLQRSSSTKAKPWREWDQDHIWHPFTQMRDWLNEQPLVIERAQGVFLYDSEGRSYLDGVSSLWVNVHGHRHPALDRAVQEQLNRMSHSTLLGLTHPPAAELAHRLLHVAPKGFSKVFYSDNGSTAVEVAVKMAYQYWQNQGDTRRRWIAHLENAYHGDTLGSVSVGGIDLFHKVYRRLTFPTLAVPFPDGYRHPSGKTYPRYFEESVEKMDRLFHRYQGQVAALVVEPIVQAAAGMIVWPRGILKAIQEVCRRHDVFLIADEVATGFGRTGRMFACEHEGVTPDFLCLAKGLSGGYLPLAATLTTNRVFDGFLFDYKEQKTFFHGHTFTGNPLGCAAALASLDIFHRERVLSRLPGKINYLSRKLREIQDMDWVGQVRQKGLMVGIELVKDRRRKTPFLWEDRVGVRVCLRARRYGVILRPLGNVIVLMPPLAITKEQIDHVVESVRRSIVDVRRERGK